MRIFITGGTGFIGQPLVKKLQERGHNLHLLSANLSEPEKWKKEIESFQPDVCIHLAWEGLPDYSVENSRKNINYSLDLLTFLADIGCKTILSVGSTWEYKGRFPEGAVEGIIITKPADVFSVAKWIINLWGTAVVEEKNRHIENCKEELKFIWARIFFVYGPGQRETSLIPYLLNCAKIEKSPEIKNPSAENDFIYIDDVTEAIAVLLEKSKKSGECDIGWGKLISNQEVINIVAQKLGRQDWYREVSSSEDRVSFSPVADNKKLKEMGWEPKVGLEEGIQKMIDFYLSKS